MKVLLINAVDYSVEVETRYPSLGLAYLAGVLRARFGASAFEFRIITHDVERVLATFRPDVVGVSAVTQNFGFAQRYAAQAKKRGIPVFAGGVHLSALPSSLTKDMDAGCVGEGEETVAELFSLLLKSGRTAWADLASVKGIAFWEKDTLRVNPSRELIKNLDVIPFPARDLLGIERHSYLFTSRGCPYRCVFCASSVFWKRTRFFSAEYVVREIEELVENYGVRLISFFDDLFIGDIARLRKIVSLLEDNERLRKVRFTCSGRANLINDEIAGLLKRMRVGSVGMGLESGSDKTLRYLKGDSISVEDGRRAINVLRKHGIAANASFVIGSPNETRQDMLETYRFIKKSRLNLFDTYVLTPYPGTALWEYARAKGLVYDTMDWTKLNVNFYRNTDNAVIMSETMSRKAIAATYRKFQRLRLVKNMINVWRTPQVSDLLRFMIKKIREYALFYLRKP